MWMDGCLCVHRGGIKIGARADCRGAWVWTVCGGVCDVLRCDLLFRGGVERRMGVLDVNCAMRNVGDQEVAESPWSKQSMTGGPWRAL